MLEAGTIARRRRGDVGSFEPIIEHLGIRYSWGHDDDGAVRMTFERGRT